MGRFLSEDPVFWNNSQLTIQLVDPQSWNTYAYARNNPVLLSDPNGEFWEEVKQSILGFSNALVTNSLLGLGRQNYDNAYFQAGQAVGDAASLIQGSLEMAFGAAAAVVGAGGGLVLAPVSFGGSVAAGVAVSAGGVVAAGHGFGVAKTASYNLTQRVGKGFSSQSAPTNQKIGDLIAEHSYQKHVVEKREFGSLIQSKGQLSEYIRGVLSNPSETKQLESGRTAYWDDRLGSVVIYNSKMPEKSTVFRPPDGKSYFSGLK